jgi:UDP-N-acetylmuramoyl-tripeptide--D-alanyl-D-alanine ligase
MIKLMLSEAAAALDAAEITCDVEFNGISIDTRTLLPNNLFVAIKGEQFDGHNYVAEASTKRATAALVSQKLDLPIPQLIVKDTIAALGKISALWRNRFSLPFIGVTGSNGKTTLKNMIASILRAACHNDTAVLATEGNLNNNIGVPLMLSRLNDKHCYSVIEMGMNHFGEIDYLTHLVRPQVAVINNAAAAHLEGLENVSGVARAKGEIFSGLTANGIAILNRDDAFFNYWQNLVKNHQQLTFGLQNPADISASILSSSITIHTPQGNIDVVLPLLGRHNVMNALAATAATLALDIKLDAIKCGLENVKPAPGRLRQHTLSNHIKIIDDTYNANPASVDAAINTLATFSGTKILVLGDMKELGENAKDHHADIGQKAKNAGIHCLFTFGDLSNAACQVFGDNAWHFTDRDELVEKVKPHLKENTVILIKGSRSMRMEKIVAGLLPHNEQNKTEHTH